MILAPRRPLAEHLVRYRLADLFLDSFPCNAHTTASDALWVGCPVLTMAGSTFVSRVAGSLLTTLKMPELITASIQEYRAKALQLAQEPEFLAEMRDRLEANRQSSGLFSGERFARIVEKAFLKMKEIHDLGLRPHGFQVDSDVSVLRL